MAVAPKENPTKVRKMLLDEATGVKHSADVGLWPFSDNDPEMRMWTGEIVLETAENGSPVTFKIRCSGKQRLQKYWRCCKGSGVLQPNDVHYINVKVPEEDIYTAKITLLLNGQPHQLVVYKMPNLEELYWGKNDTEQPKKETTRWDMVDKDLLKNLPSGVAEYIKGDKEQSLRQLVFRTTQPLVYQMLADLGNYAKKETDRPGYYDVSCESKGLLDGIMEYVVGLMEEHRIEEKKEDTQDVA